ncbi:Nucleotide-binding universal stress protein, UspA family [Modicisalibacter ilicicola DSM 19980]|uniref:Nucleotide-binding universal stress protein, UspA family n=1 Tax=Modicisalibacter ilicicola DSM 19980 TaxID=1121942 RepID=A0A1M4WCB8_9GAMM|nr:universal stress protein [Halomonas ilicicola]SHE78931.1 Nucleotide-binding universal stress protein, UspA family [Halomonas ilicicola DSM 19980]
MKIMIAYDGSRNAKLALAQIIDMFRPMKPSLLLVGVAENPRDATDANESLFQEEYDELKRALEEGVAFAQKEEFEAETLLAEGDARKGLLQATQKKTPDLLVIARHSHKPDGGIIAQSLTYFVDELDYMTFGSVSSFLARRAECPLLILPSP